MTQIEKCIDSAVSCAKTAEPIKLQFAMLSWVGPENIHALRGNVDAPHGKGHFWVVWPIVKHIRLYPGIAPGWGYYFKPTKTKNPEKKN